MATKEKLRLTRLEMLECTNFADLSAPLLASIEDEDFYLDSSDATLSRNRAGAGVKAGVGLLALRGALRDRMYVASGLMDSTSSSSSSSLNSFDSSKKATRFLAGGTNAMISQARKLRKVSEVVAIEMSAEGEGLNQRDDEDFVLQRTSQTALFGWKSSDGVSGAISFLGSRENSKKYVDAAAGKAKRPARRFCGSCGRCSSVAGVALMSCTICSTNLCSSKSCTADHKASGRCPGGKKS